MEHHGRHIYLALMGISGTWREIQQHGHISLNMGEEVAHICI